jgi:hypothetical protein
MTHWEELETTVLFQNEQEAMAETKGISVPFTILPIGRSKGRLVAIDASVAALETGRLGLVEARENGYWAPLSNNQQGQVFAEKVGFSALVHRVNECQKSGDEDMEVSLMSALFRRPVYTAEHTDQVMEVMDRVHELHKARGAETLSHRLSTARTDGEKWRIVGAERAIAGRTRDAVVALSGAHFFGAELSMIALPAAQTLGNAGWKWNSRMLKFHKRRLRESS